MQLLKQRNKRKKKNEKGERDKIVVVYLQSFDFRCHIQSFEEITDKKSQQLGSFGYFKVDGQMGIC